MGSSSAILPASTSCKVATAVNILFIDPRRNCVSSVLGRGGAAELRPQRRGPGQQWRSPYLPAARVRGDQPRQSRSAGRLPDGGFLHPPDAGVLMKSVLEIPPQGRALPERVSRKGAPTVETPRGASPRRRPRPCSLRRPAGAPWHLGSSSLPRTRPTGRLYSRGPDGIATFETPSEV